MPRVTQTFSRGLLGVTGNRALGKEHGALGPRFKIILEIKLTMSIHLQKTLLSKWIKSKTVIEVKLNELVIS